LNEKKRPDKKRDLHGKKKKKKDLNKKKKLDTVQK
jgi:hypothetical protein